MYFDTRFHYGNEYGMPNISPLVLKKKFQGDLKKDPSFNLFLCAYKSDI